MAAKKFLRVRGVLERYSVGTTKLYAEIRAGRLPAPCKLGTTSLWSVAELDEFDRRLTAGVDSARTAAANAKTRKTRVTEAQP